MDTMTPAAPRFVLHFVIGNGSEQTRDFDSTQAREDFIDSLLVRFGLNASFDRV